MFEEKLKAWIKKIVFHYNKKNTPHSVECRANTQSQSILYVFCGICALIRTISFRFSQNMYIYIILKTIFVCWWCFFPSFYAVLWSIHTIHTIHKHAAFHLFYFSFFFVLFSPFTVSVLVFLCTLKIFSFFTRVCTEKLKVFLFR